MSCFFSTLIGFARFFVVQFGCLSSVLLLSSIDQIFSSRLLIGSALLVRWSFLLYSSIDRFSSSSLFCSSRPFCSSCPYIVSSRHLMNFFLHHLLLCYSLSYCTVYWFCSFLGAVLLFIPSSPVEHSVYWLRLIFKLLTYIREKLRLPRWKMVHSVK